MGHESEFNASDRCKCDSVDGAENERTQDEAHDGNPNFYKGVDQKEIGQD